MTYLSSLVPVTGWSGRFVPSDTAYRLKVPVGSLLVETANTTREPGISMIDANHRPLLESKETCGSDSDEAGSPKKLSSPKVALATAPVLV
jgi:hypothetical protein